MDIISCNSFTYSVPSDLPSLWSTFEFVWPVVYQYSLIEMYKLTCLEQQATQSILDQTTLILTLSNEVFKIWICKVLFSFRKLQWHYSVNMKIWKTSVGICCSGRGHLQKISITFILQMVVWNSFPKVALLTAKLGQNVTYLMQIAFHLHNSCSFLTACLLF